MNTNNNPSTLVHGAVASAAAAAGAPTQASASALTPVPTPTPKPPRERDREREKERRRERTERERERERLEKEKEKENKKEHHQPVSIPPSDSQNQHLKQETTIRNQDLIDLQSLRKSKEELESRLRKLEVQIYDLETSYLEDTMMRGNVVRGWLGGAGNKKDKERMDGGIQASDGGGGLGSVDRERAGPTASRKSRSFKRSDRVFSNSSVTSPVYMQMQQQMHPSPGSGNRVHGNVRSEGGAGVGGGGGGGGGPPRKKKKVVLVGAEREDGGMVPLRKKASSQG
eukprot:CAMPEP_0184708206 /NCGR_PEP_ID=MMETSP0313-20130426/37657_1 /TAXON_ID=2792 /ORGANISM="Porphyridium aerugineum, Strain SAG 1380-2" /LENGTH=284 /DNA_ID=CAMNT_0027169789 /DNA_START=61 /DNA_END=915 /DNA_ORIENTATION=+